MVESRTDWEVRQRYAAANMTEQEHSLVHVFMEYFSGGDNKIRQWCKERKTLRDIQEEICIKIDTCIGHGTANTKAAEAKLAIRNTKSFAGLWVYFNEAIHNAEGNSVKKYRGRSKY